MIYFDISHQTTRYTRVLKQYATGGTRPRSTSSVKLIPIRSCLDDFGVAMPRLHAILFAAVMLTASSLPAADPLVYISAFAPGDKGAIHAFRLDAKAGSLTPLQRTADVEHPFFLALSPDNRFLYSIDAKTFGKGEEFVAAYKIVDRDGRLERLNKQPAKGTAACYLDVDATGKAAVVANYTTGNLASFPVRADGSLREAVSFFQHAGSSVNPKRQMEPHAHCIVISPNNKHVYVADLGLDQVRGYQLDAKTAKLTPNPQPFVRTIPGAGPRHLTFHPNGKYVYVINELKNSVTRFDYAADSGTLIERQTISTLPKDFDGVTHCADLKITPNGKYLYGTNRGHDSLAAYAIADDGELTLLEIIPSRGKGPQNLLIADEGRLLICANMAGDNVSVFRIEDGSGKLQAVGELVEMPRPSCIMLVP